LEKSRVVFQTSEEQNFHVFYYLFASPDHKEKFSLGPAESYPYLSNIDGVDVDLDEMYGCRLSPPSLSPLVLF